MNQIKAAHQAQELAAESTTPVVMLDPQTLKPVTNAQKPLPPEKPKQLLGDAGPLGTLQKFGSQSMHGFHAAPLSLAVMKDLIVITLTEEEKDNLRLWQARAEALIKVINDNARGEVARRHVAGIFEDTIGHQGIEKHDTSIEQRQQVAREKRQSARLELEDFQKEFAPICREILQRLVVKCQSELEIVEANDAARAAEYGIEHAMRSEVYMAVARTLAMLRIRAETMWEKTSGSEFTPRTIVGEFIDF